jgi:hypothetical protein
MGDSIYLVDPATKQPVRVDSVSFASIGIRERSDLEQWVINHPELLGEPLLIITSEFASFDRSSKRLDVLALDKNGTLVVIEIKLDIAGSLADQQAIRYAAFCSTMTMANVVEYYARYHEVDSDDAEDSILRFLEEDELPQLDDRPRIILAAGSMDDQELTACVIWLRRFGLDISCVELTPYRMPQTEQVILVPRVIIPLPEAEKYIVRAERKDVARVQEEKAKGENEELWREVGKAFNAFGLELRTAGNSKNNFMQIHVRSSTVHYEWLRRKRDRCIDIAIHFESSDESLNKQMLLPFEARRAEIESGLGQPLMIAPFGKKWTQVKISLPYTGTEPAEEIAPKAAALMKTFIERTWAILKPLLY